MSDKQPFQTDVSNDPPSKMAESVNLTPSPLNGVIPPVEHRIQPGEVRNPRGRGSAGYSVIEWMDTLQDKTEDELTKIARDRSEKPTKRAAAIEWLDRIAGGFDMADFEELCDGTTTLKALRNSGVPTRLLKKVKTRTIRSKDGETETQREVELNDKGGQALDRIMDRTAGKATQRTEHTGADGGPIQVQTKFVIERRPTMIEGDNASN